MIIRCPICGGKLQAVSEVYHSGITLDEDGDIDAKDLKKLRKESVEAVAEETEEEAAEAEEEEHAEDVALGSADKDFRELVDTIEDVVGDMDLNLEDGEEEEQDIAAGEGEEPTPPQDSPA